MDIKTKLQMLDPATIIALLKIYNLSYKNLALLLRCTRQNIVYLLKYDRLNEYQTEIILELFKQHGLEDTELVLIHYMTRKVTQLT